MADGIELATAYVSLTVDGSQVTPGVRRALGSTSAAADRAGAQAGKSFGSRFAAMAKSPIGAISGLVGAGALVGIAKDSIQLEASFSKTMAQVQASTNAGGKAMDAMRAKAMKLGADTAFSASDAAGAMLELAKAGISTKDIMGGALAGTLTLAAAGDTDLATASTIASNAMNTFNLRGRDMSKIAAALAGGANASSASVESLGQGLSQVGPAATNAGLTLNDTVAALSAFDAAGIKGSDAGTSLKTMLVALVPQTKQAKKEMQDLGLHFKDAHGNIVPLTNVAQQLHDKLSGLSQAQRISALNTIFGSDASRAATVLMKQGAKGLEKYIKATKDQGAAEKMAKANMSGTAGALEQLSGSIETAELALGQALAPTVQKVAGMLTNDVLPPVTEFIGQMQSGKGAGGQFADILKSLASTGQDLAGAVVDTAVPLGKDLLPAFKDGVDLAQKLAGFLDDIPGPIKKVGVEGVIAALAFAKITRATGFLSGKIGGVRTALSGYRTDLALTRASMGQIGPVTREAAAAQERMAARSAKLKAGISSLAGAGGMLLLMDSTQRTNKSVGQLERTAGIAAVGFAVGGPLGLAVGATGGLFLSAFQNIKKANSELSVSQRIAKEAAGGWDTLTDSLNKNTGAFTKNSAAAAGADLAKDASGKKLIDFARNYGVSQTVLGKALIGNQPALSRVNNLMAMLGEQSSEAKARNDELSASIANGGSAYSDWLSYIGSGGTQSWSQYKGSIEDTIKANQDLINDNDALRRTWTDQSRGVGQAQNALRDHMNQLKAYKLEQKGIPKKVATNFEALSGPASKKIKDLIRAYHLTPKEVRTLAKADGVDLSKKQLAGLIDLARRLGQESPNVHVSADVTDATTRITSVFRELDRLDGYTANTYVRSHHIGGPVQANASGSLNNPGGWSWVGEEGPELMYLPKGTDIYSNQRSRQMIANNAGGTGAAIPGGASIDLSGMTFQATITNWDEGTIRMEAIADDRVDAHGLMVGQTRRARGGF